MAEIRLPISITYETTGITPVSDLIAALRATDLLMADAVSLLPSLIDGLQVEASSLNVRFLSQESPLREAFFVALLLTFQEDLKREVPSLFEDWFGIEVTDKYDTILTVVFLTVVFYGAALAVDAAKKMIADSLPRAKYDELVAVLASETGKSAGDIRKILDAKFSKPAPAKRLLAQVKRVFLPSQREKNVPVLLDRDRIDSETIREIPYPTTVEKRSDFDRFTPYSGVELEVHAMDKDRSSTGWAAVAPSISPKRLKMRLMDPISANDLFGREKLTGDVVVVSKLTSEGFAPHEIQLTAISD